METVEGDASTRADAGDIDVWGEAEQAEHSPRKESEDLAREWDARRLQFHNLGYRDGITAGNNSSVQEGFNVGYKEAVEPAFDWGVARGASSAFSALPASLKELLLKDKKTRERMEGLHSKMSSISSADAMGMYYEDSVLKSRTAGENIQGDDLTRLSVPVLSEEGNQEGSPGDHLQPEDSSDRCCGGGTCGSSTVCRSSIAGDPNSAPKSSNTYHELESGGKKPISQMAHDLVLGVSSSSGDRKYLEDSSTSLLTSLALTGTEVSASSSTSFFSSSRLQHYYRQVEAELDRSDVKVAKCSVKTPKSHICHEW